MRPGAVGEAWALVRQAFADWQEDGAPRLGAALATLLVGASGVFVELKSSLNVV